jgi:hypothetical protein
VTQDDLIEFFSKVGFIGASAFNPIVSTSYYDTNPGGFSDKIIYIYNTLQNNIGLNAQAFSNNFILGI